MPFTVKVKKDKKGFNSFTLTMTELTSGKIEAIIRGLMAIDSPVGNDLLPQLKREYENLLK